MEVLDGLVLAIASAATSVGMQLLKKGSAWVAGLPADVKKVVVAVLAVGVTYVSKLLGVDLPLDPTTWTADVLNAALVAVVSMGFYTVIKRPKA